MCFGWQRCRQYLARSCWRWSALSRSATSWCSSATSRSPTRSPSCCPWASWFWTRRSRVSSSCSWATPGEWTAPTVGGGARHWRPAVRAAPGGTAVVVLDAATPESAANHRYVTGDVIDADGPGGEWLGCSVPTARCPGSATAPGSAVRDVPGTAAADWARGVAAELHGTLTTVQACARGYPVADGSCRSSRVPHQSPRRHPPRKRRPKRVSSGSLGRWPLNSTSAGSR